MMFNFVCLGCSFFLFSFGTHALENNHVFKRIEELKETSQWAKLVQIGEEAATEYREQGESLDEFKVTSELVSTLFRLGKLNEANLKIKRLFELAAVIQEPTFLVETFYKTSAVVRVQADMDTNPEKKKVLFDEARVLIKKAAEQQKEFCATNQKLRAIILFNTGAIESDDPKGNRWEAVKIFKEALEIFAAVKENDYHQRTSMRLAKAYLNLNDLAECAKVLDTISAASMKDQRTLMHYYFLLANFRRAESEAMKDREDGIIKKKEAFQAAQIARAIALQLNAQVDLERIEILLKSF